MIKNITNSYEHIPYTLKHRKAFLKIEKQLLKRNTIAGYFHDLDKIIFYILLPFLGTENIQKIHRTISRHHVNRRKNPNYIAMVIDWECARYTKPDKPLNARETLNKYFSHISNKVLPAINKLGL